jgi:hypothetical protein
VAFSLRKSHIEHSRQEHVYSGFALVLLVVLSVCGPGSAQGKQPIRSEQRHFSLEDSKVKRPVAIPVDVLAILSKDELVRDVLENDNLPADKLPQSWFLASAIHLGDTDEIDLVVVGEGPLIGANVTTFWVFRATPNGHELALTAVAHDLTVKKTSWKGYREIELLSTTAMQQSSVMLRWDGKQYSAYQETLEPNQ